MRITKLYIEKYKNLQDFEWELNPNSPITAIIGKNASGKTNLLAAIMEIFGQCYAYINGKNHKSFFTFSISYQTIYKGQDTLITFKWENNQYALFQNNDPSLAIRERDALPDRIFTYYAGELTTFTNIIGKYNAWGFFSYLFLQDNQFLLLSMFGSRLESIKEDILKKQIKIERLVDFTIVLQNPRKKISSTKPPTIENFWNAPTHLAEFYQELRSVSSEIKIDKTFRNSKLILTIKAEGFAKIMENRYEYDLNELLKESSGKGFIRKIENFSFIKEGVNTPIDFEDLSEGERQRIGLLGAFAVYQGKEALFLLDEPDAFAHPSWQNRLIEDIRNALDSEVRNSQVILTSHSPNIISNVFKNELTILSNINGTVQLKTVTFNPYGQSIENVLIDFFDMETLRYAVKGRIEELWNLIKSNAYESETFAQKMEEFKGIVGQSDKDVMRMNLEIANRKKLRTQNNEKDK